MYARNCLSGLKAGAFFHTRSKTNSRPRPKKLDDIFLMNKKYFFNLILKVKDNVLCL